MKINTVTERARPHKPRRQGCNTARAVYPSSYAADADAEEQGGREPPAKRARKR